MINGKPLSEIRIGILGGGQLGKLLCFAANNWDLKTCVLDPTPDCPSSNVCSEFILGSFRDYDDVIKLKDKADIVTIEIEHVNIEALMDLESSGIEVRPSPKIIEIIKDKGLQKNFYRQNGIPTSEFIICEGRDDVLKKLSQDTIKMPFVQKVCRDGYDGRGVQIVDSDDKLNNLLEGECVVEELVKIKKEISVIVAHNARGDIKCFKPVEMIFNYDANLVDYLLSPAGISNELSEQAESLAVDTIKAYGLRGILAVEMFLNEDDNLLVNEVAPRPHNSGHHTIESCVTSQYEQHIRSLLDLPLGDTKIKLPAVMLNLLGEPGHEGKAVYDGLEECLSIEGASFHIYGKKMTKPFRKMGHVTIVDSGIENALKKADYIKNNLKVVS